MTTDEQLVALVQQGQKEWYGTLIERYEAKMFRYGKRFLSDAEDLNDIVQTVFVKAYINIKSFNLEMRFSPWLYRIAHNELVNALKKKKREPFFSFDVDTFLPHPVASEESDKESLDEDTKQMMDQFLEKLESKYREPLILFYYEELSYKEISEILHIPVSTVGVRISRGKKVLRDMYDELG
jgi:RNA polymerase sigma-70 factor (ECF subfamily)